MIDAARELFDRNNLFEPDAYRELFAEVEKTDEIKAAVGVERPNGRTETHLKAYVLPERELDVWDIPEA